MKKIIIGLLLSLFIHAAQAQIAQYRINMNLFISDPTGNSGGGCKNDFHIYFFYPQTGWKDVWFHNTNLGTTMSWLRQSVQVNADQLPIAIYATGSRNWWHNVLFGAGYCAGDDDLVGAASTLPTSPCVSQTYTDIIPDWKSSLTVSIEPVQVAIQASSTFLPDADKVTLTATPGFASSIYDWQFSADGTTWKEFPGNLQGQSTISFTGMDLYPGNFLSQIPKNTFIRVFTSCGGPTLFPPFIPGIPFSNKITLSNRLSSPHLISATASPNRCFGEANGTIRLQFDRPLLPNETLNITATDVSNISHQGSTSVQNITLDAGNSYLLQNMLAASYTIGFIGSYGGANTYTDGPAQTAFANVISPSAVTYTATKLNDVRCYGGSDGSIGINATGGVGNYQLGYQGPGQGSYNWMAFNSGGQTVLPGLSPGNYSLRVMDGNGCVQKDASLNEVITAIPIAQPATPVQLDFSSVVNPLAYGSMDGSVTAVVKGGTPAAGGAYTINWTDPLGNGVATVMNTALSSGYQTVLNNGGNGNYTLQATDANYTLAPAGQQQGCILRQTFTLAQPPPLVLNIEQTKRVTCHGYATAQLVAHGNGGIEIPGVRYHYQWTVQNGGIQSVIGADDSVLSQLPAGYYQVTITDKNGITKTSLFTVGEPGVLAATIATTPLACNGDSNSVATPTVTGGTMPYSYSWSTGDTTAVIGHLTEGGYFLFVSDSNACQTQQTATISSPGGLLIDTVVTPPTCNQGCDGSIQLNVTGGAGGYSYVWNTGGAGSGLTALCAGDYNVRIRDVNGCTALRKFSLNNPPLLVVKAGQNTTLCTGQTYAANATIGDPAARYQWMGSNGFSASTSRVSLSDPGTYWVTVTDSRGCSGRDSFAISRIDKNISADFVVATQVFQGEQVTVVNISKPDPDSINWMIPDTSAITVLKKDQVSATLLFNDTGSYAIGMKSWSAPCWMVAQQSVVVLKAQTFDNAGTVTNPLVQSFTVAPNPTTGSFIVTVKLSSVVNIRLRMVSMLSDAVMDDRRFNGNSLYTISYNMSNIAKGGYFLLLETPAGSSVFKIVIL